jgi:hypothetical protein
MPSLFARAAASAMLLALPACASAPPPPPVAPDPAPAPAEVPVAPARPARPLDLTNNCGHEVYLYYGDQPGDGKGERGKVAPGGVIAVPRNPDGAVVVWVVDEKGFGLASVHVTHRMSHVRIDSACARIDAD